MQEKILYEEGSSGLYPEILKMRHKDNTEPAVTACDAFSCYLSGMNEIYSVQFNQLDTPLAKNLGKGIRIIPLTAVEFAKNTLLSLNDKTTSNIEKFENVALKTSVNILSGSMIPIQISAPSFVCDKVGNQFLKAAEVYDDAIYELNQKKRIQGVDFDEERLLFDLYDQRSDTLVMGQLLKFPQQTINFVQDGLYEISKSVANLLKHPEIVTELLKEYANIVAECGIALTQFDVLNAEMRPVMLPSGISENRFNHPEPELNINLSYDNIFEKLANEFKNNKRINITENLSLHPRKDLKIYLIIKVIPKK